MDLSALRQAGATARHACTSAWGRRLRTDPRLVVLVDAFAALDAQIARVERQGRKPMAHLVARAQRALRLVKDRVTTLAMETAHRARRNGNGTAEGKEET